MKTKLVLLFTAVLTLTSLSSCVDPYFAGGGYGGGYSNSYYRPSYGGYSNYSSGYRTPYYGYSGNRGFGGYGGGFGGYGGGFGGHHGGFGGGCGHHR